MSELNIRPLNHYDIPALVEIENEAFEFPWPAAEFQKCGKHNNTWMGWVMECDFKIIGYMVYDRQETCLELLSFAIHKSYRRESKGRILMLNFLNKLSSSLQSARAMVRERNLAGQLFLKAMGWKCIKILYGQYLESIDEDSYLFEYRWKNEHE